MIGRQFYDKVLIAIVLLIIFSLSIVSAQTFYIDPTNTNDMNQDGSVEHPFDSWSDAHFYSGYSYLQKRGTIDTLNTTMEIEVSNVTFGAYGSGDKPKIYFDLAPQKYAISAYAKRNLVFENLEIFTNGNGTSCIYFNAFCNGNVVDSCILHDAVWGLRITTGNNKNHKILNTTIYNIADDGIFIQDAADIEIAYCYLHHINTNWKPPETSQSLAGGDCIQLDRVANWYVHHNLMDRSTTGNKFCFISGGDTPGCILEHNDFISPKATNEGGACVYFAAGDSVIIRYNTFKDSELTGLYSHSDHMSIYGNIFTNVPSAIFAGTSTQCELYNNVFFNVNQPVSATAIVAKNNIFDVDASVTRPLKVTNLTESHNHYSTGSGGDRATFGDPLFVDPENGDFHLQNSSPCIDAGIDVGIAVDKDSNAIPQNGTPDIGAFEFADAAFVLDENVHPDEFYLAQNYPNPFNPSTIIQYSLAHDADVHIFIFNSLGQKIRELFNGNQSAGQHCVLWNGLNDAFEKVTSGVYFCQLSTEDFSESQKMILMR